MSLSFIICKMVIKVWWEDGRACWSQGPGTPSVAVQVSGCWPLASPRKSLAPLGVTVSLQESLVLLCPQPPDLASARGSSRNEGGPGRLDYMLQSGHPRAWQTIATTAAFHLLVMVAGHRDMCWAELTLRHPSVPHRAGRGGLPSP